jgi:hypothetical protein
MHEPECRAGMMQPYATPSASDLENIKASALDRSYISMGNRRTNSVHEFYRYPARFSPLFAKSVIDGFSNPGDLVLDPFLGGGTTAVEAMLGARRFLGSDINSLAVFIAEAKTAIQNDESTRELESWAARVPSAINIKKAVDTDLTLKAGEYLRNISTRETWRLRKAIGQAVESLADISCRPAERLARCSILRTAQWALDMRRVLPTVDEFRAALVKNAIAMSAVAEEFSEDVESVASLSNDALGTQLLHQGLPGLSSHPDVIRAGAPRLVVTSPPYPGVYVLYHRWKVRGRKETPAPYWVAGTLDGHGQAHYTMSARADKGRNFYFDTLAMAYQDLVRTMDTGTWLVQIVGFGNAHQLARFLSVMEAAGLDEVTFEATSTSDDGRLWRDVPGRRWWVSSDTLSEVAPSTSREVVLFHRPRS